MKLPGFGDFHPTRWPWFRKFFYGMVALLRPEILDIRYGYRLQVPKSERSAMQYFLWASGDYEREQSELANEILTPGDIAIDVGANYGYFTCLFARRIGPQGKVFAFEPDTGNFSVLTANVARNALQNVECRKIGWSQDTGEKALYLSPESPTQHSLLPSADAKQSIVSTTSGDAFIAAEMQPHDVIRLVKIDVEGHELAVLEGLRNTLASQRILNLIVEFSPHRIRSTDRNPADLLAILDAAGFAVRVMSSTAPQQYSDMNVLRAHLSEIAANPHWFFYLHATYSRTAHDGTAKPPAGEQR